MAVGTDVSRALKSKLFGLPAPLVVGGALVAGYLVYRGFSRPRAPGAAAAPGAESIYGLGYAQGLQGAQPPPPPPAPPTSQSRARVAGIRQGNVGTEVAHDVYSGDPAAGPLRAISQMPFNTQVTVLGLPQQAQVPQSGLLGGNPVPVTVYPIQGPAGSTLWMQGVDLIFAGVGGAARSIGSRTAELMWHGHPLLKQSIRYPQYVRAGGGPAGHQAAVHRAARQAGVHPAQVLAANPHYTGLIRIR